LFKNTSVESTIDDDELAQVEQENDDAAEENEHSPKNSKNDSGETDQKNQGPKKLTKKEIRELKKLRKQGKITEEQRALLNPELVLKPTTEVRLCSILSSFDCSHS
jgi:hypothetical protein